MTAPADAGRKQAMRPVLDAWVRLIGMARAASLPIVYTSPVSRADGADVVLLPTDLGARTGVPSRSTCVYCAGVALAMPLAPGNKP